jgi:transposase-like protein
MSKNSSSRPLSESEGFALISSYFQSGLRPSEYYKNYGITEWQFYNWRRRYLAAHPEMSKSGVSPEKKRFREIRIEPVASPVACSLEIRYPNGVIVAVPAGSGMDVEALSVLIKLGTSCSA